ncbi:MBL fold metallo-hydrolase [Desulfobacula phenolica]|uniref:Rhodanese-related sulfurtransferase n=1 Tax=Desulfobacula phenolica TaxID=90732 RepID=A0A1H2JJA9_9BACT|nr:rhodanese-like domain-containing protein [Desulfobacula phenolica]SDU56624.1 Rhodanese-related sulfurtransferase [Desulfobacula phenolica]
MYFNQISVVGLGCQSYCIGCPAAKTMMVVDPKRDIQDYLEIAFQEGMNITHIINTHLHADHVSGDQELSAATGADIYINDSVEINYPHKNIEHGDILTLGAAKIEVLHTPGHTPNSISLVVTDTSRSSEPQMILTGDLLFVGDIGRPDLPGAEILDEQVENLYNSLYKTLANYPDHLEVYPAHAEGSLCGRGMSAKKSSTLGYERKANHMLCFNSFEEFKNDITSAFPVKPKSFAHIIATNRKGADLLDACTMDKRLTPRHFQELMEDKGTLILDTRGSAAYGGFHIPGSINIGFEKQLANWVGMVIDPKSELLLVVDDREAYDRMTTELHRIGYDAIIGYLSGGINAWLMSGRPVEQLTQISPLQLQLLLGPDCPKILDVRTLAEWDSGHIHQARHLPLTDILEGNIPDMDKNQEIILQCGSGYRSNIAASFFKEAGFTNLKSLAGGIFAWSNANLPLV